MVQDKFFIFVAFASLALCASAIFPTVNYELPEDYLYPLNGIAGYEGSTLMVKLAIGDALFDTIEREAATSMCKYAETRTSNIDVGIETAKMHAKVGIRVFLYSVEILVGGSCSAIENTVNTTSADIEHGYGALRDALILAKSGGLFADDIEAVKDVVAKDIAHMNECIYDALRTCLDTDDAQITAAIQSSYERSNLASVHVIHSIFNGLKTYVDTANYGTKRVGPLIQEIRASRNRALFGIRTEVEHQFTLLRALCLYSKLEHTGILPGLMAIQYALIAGSNRNQESASAVFDIIESNMNRLALGFSDDDDVDFFQTDSAHAPALAELDAGNSFVLASLPYIGRNGSSASEISTESIDRIKSICRQYSQMSGYSSVSNVRTISSCSRAPIRYFDALKIANTRGSNYAEAQKEIEALRNATISQLPEFISSFYYGLIRSDELWDADSEAQFTIVRERTHAVIEEYLNHIYDAILLLLKVTHAGEVTKDDDSALRILRDETMYALAAVTWDLSAASLIAFMANNFVQ